MLQNNFTFYSPLIKKEYVNYLYTTQYKIPISISFKRILKNMGSKMKYK